MDGNIKLLGIFSSLIIISLMAALPSLSYSQSASSLFNQTWGLNNTNVGTYGICYLISNLTQRDALPVPINGTTFHLTVNFITPTTAGVSVNNTAYTLNQSSLQGLLNTSSYRYTIELMSIYYIPIEQTITLEMCSTGDAPHSNSSIISANLIVKNGANLSSIPIVSNDLSAQLGFWPGNISISTSNVISNSIYLSISNVTSSVPRPPDNYSLLVAANITLNYTYTTNATISLELRYGCGLNESRLQPFILKNQKWSKIINSTLNSYLCSISFSIPQDPTIALMYLNSSSKPINTTTYKTTTVSTSTISQKGQTNAQGNKNKLLIVAVLIVLLIITAVLFVLKQKRRKRFLRHGY